MKKGLKVFAVLALSLFLISMIAGVVSAGPLNELVSKFSQKGFGLGESAKEGLTKFLLVALVIMMVYSITLFLPFVPAGKEYIGWIISIIVGILSFIYVDPIEIKAIVSNYEALGIALTSILPFVIIIVFTYKMREGYPEMASLINKPLLVIFILYLMYRWVDLYNQGSDLAIMYFITAIITFGWLLAEKWIYFKIAKAFLRGDVDEAKDMYMGEVAGKLRKLYDLRTTASGTTLVKLDKQIAELEEILKKGYSP